MLRSYCYCQLLSFISIQNVRGFRSSNAMFYRTYLFQFISTKIEIKDFQSSLGNLYTSRLFSLQREYHQTWRHHTSLRFDFFLVFQGKFSTISFPTIMLQ